MVLDVGAIGVSIAIGALTLPCKPLSKSADDDYQNLRVWSSIVAGAIDSFLLLARLTARGYTKQIALQWST
ncbi:MAG TPA: hypothetical protein VED00_02050 [archaeon]|nr:hypothetical protein [archaeon]